MLMLPLQQIILCDRVYVRRCLSSDDNVCSRTTAFFKEVDKMVVSFMTCITDVHVTQPLLGYRHTLIRGSCIVSRDRYFFLYVHIVCLVIFNHDWLRGRCLIFLYFSSVHLFFGWYVKVMCHESRFERGERTGNVFGRTRKRAGPAGHAPPTAMLPKPQGASYLALPQHSSLWESTWVFL